MTDQKKLVLVDGNSLAYRAFFALPLLSNDKGTKECHLWLCDDLNEDAGRREADSYARSI